MSKDVVNPMPAHDTSDPSYVTGPVQAVVPDYVAKGRHHPHQHRDAQLAHLADLSGESSVGHGTSATDAQRRRAPASHAPSSALRLKGKRVKK